MPHQILLTSWAGSARARRRETHSVESLRKSDRERPGSHAMVWFSRPKSLAKTKDAPHHEAQLMKFEARNQTGRSVDGRTGLPIRWLGQPHGQKVID